MVKAMWNNAVLAEAAQTEIVEGNHYFPPESCTGNISARAQRNLSATGRVRRAITRSWSMAKRTGTPPGPIRPPKRLRQKSPARSRSERAFKLRPDEMQA
jgi:hypothetical protein